MVSIPIFLGNWMRALHRVHLTQALQNDDRFETVSFRLAGPRERGSYRVVGSTRTNWLLDDPDYPATGARLEVGFADSPDDADYWYWINWIEPERSFMLGWHRDDDHPNLGPTHLQITQGGSVVDRVAVDPIDEHPGAIFYRRLEQLPDVLTRITWDGDDVVGFDT